MKMIKLVAVVVVVAALTAGQSALLAAPSQNLAIASERTVGLGFFMEVIRILGFNLGTPEARIAPAPRHDGSRSQPGSTSDLSRSTLRPGSGFSTDGAIWGGSGRCPTPGSCN